MTATPGAVQVDAGSVAADGPMAVRLVGVDAGYGDRIALEEVRSRIHEAIDAELEGLDPEGTA